MKNKFVVTAILIAGLTFISSYTNQLFGQTKNNKNDMNQNMNSGSMDKKNTGMMSDTTNMGKDNSSNKSMEMKSDKMMMKSDSTKMEKSSMSHNSKDMNSDKMKNDTAMMKKEKM
jgi:hypothetical protein